MGSCNFVDKLNRLRKSSSDSIDNIEKFDDFKKYMHVTRAAEEDLKSILRKVNASGKKTLVLLCGSAGDGKSHLLSYLRNFDQENLICDYRVYNDATESDSPSKTAIETLSEVLSPFRDDNLSMPGENIILAINLGVLSNFIESEYSSLYSIFRKYVEKSHILSTQINDNYYDCDSYFQHVSFSDYHMYSLTSEGVHAGYIEDILDKIFGMSEDNVFYKSYMNVCSACPLVQKCPVYKNYAYMMDRNVQKYISELLVKTTIQDKVVLTTREILNFIYDILVSQNFSYSKFQGLIDDTSYLQEFIKQITPALLFDSCDVTVLMNMIKKYDPLLSRSESADEFAISYYVNSDVSNEINKAFDKISYMDVICNEDMISRINVNKALKAQLFNLIMRVEAIRNSEIVDNVYKKYLSALFLYNAGKGKKLGLLYNMIEKGVTQWCGSDADGSLCLDDKHQGFALYEKVPFEASLLHIPKSVDSDELQRFIPFITVAFKDSDNREITLDIDYSLYELIYKLNQGYIQTADDRNNHADFISFINRILQTGSLTQSVSILSSNGRRASITKSTFGYKFKVVR